VIKGLFAVIGGGGSSGKTAAALNLSLIFAAEKKLPCALIELSYPGYAAKFLQEEELKKHGLAFFRDDGSNLHNIIERLSEKGGYVFVDCGVMPDERLLEAADRLIIPAEPVPRGIKQAQAAIAAAGSLKIPAGNIHVVINRNRDRILSAADIQEVFGRVRVTAVLPYDPAVEAADAACSLYFGKNRKSGFLSALRQYADELAGFESQKKHAEITGRRQYAEPVFPMASAEPGVQEQSRRIMEPAEALMRREIHRRLFEEMDIKNMEKDAFTHPEKKSRLFGGLREKIRIILDTVEGAPQEKEQREELVEDVFNEVAGYGAIEEYLKDPSVTEVMVNSYDRIYVEKKGRITRAVNNFTDDSMVLRAIERIVLPLGRRIDESMPYVDARLPDGSRVNAVIAPLALDGPVLTIRKFPGKKLQIEDLIGFGSITREAADYLRQAVVDRKNILISGGTGSGKTTLLNVLSSFIPGDERIITIEDSAELRLPQEHVVRLEARPPNIEGRGAVTIRDLVRNSLRMRPDRIVVGECRGGETLDMLQAMNTGHEGSMTTVHANSPRDALSRLDVLVLMAGTELPLRAIREQIRSAIDIIIQQSRMKDGRRRVTAIAEITGMEGEIILSHNVFELEPKTGVLGKYL